MCTWSYIPARQLLFMGNYSLETSLIPESKNLNGSRFRPPVPDAQLTTKVPISLTHEALLRLNPGRGVLLIATAQWITESFLERAIYRLPARRSVRVEYQHTHFVRRQRKQQPFSYLQLLTTRGHEDQRSMDDRLRPLRHCILLAQ